MNKKLVIRILLFTAFAALFAAVACFITSGEATSFDTSVQSFVFSLRNSIATGFFKYFTLTGNWQFVAPVCFVLLCFKKTRFTYGVPLSACSIVSVIFYEVLKAIFKRPRPDVSLHLVTQGGYSFPSGHSQTSFIFWGMLLTLILYYYFNKGASLPFYNKKPRLSELYPKKRGWAVGWAVICVVYILAMGFSRVYVGVHWPTDILGGWCVAGCLICAMQAVFILPRKK